MLQCGGGVRDRKRGEQERERKEGRDRFRRGGVEQEEGDGRKEAQRSW